MGWPMPQRAPQVRPGQQTAWELLGAPRSRPVPEHRKLGAPTGVGERLAGMGCLLRVQPLLPASRVVQASRVPGPRRGSDRSRAQTAWGAQVSPVSEFPLAALGIPNVEEWSAARVLIGEPAGKVQTVQAVRLERPSLLRLQAPLLFRSPPNVGQLLAQKEAEALRRWRLAQRLLHERERRSNCAWE